MTIIRKSIFTFSARALGAISQFSLSIVVARMLGVEGSGLYFLAFTVVLAGSVVGKFGFDHSLARLMGTEWAAGNIAAVKGVYLQSMLISGIASMIVVLAVFFTSNFIASSVFGAPELSDALVWMSVSILPYSLAWVHAGFLKCVGRPVFAGFVEVTGIPFMTIMLIFFCSLIQPITLEIVVICFLISSFLVLISAALGTFSSLKSKETTRFLGLTTIMAITMPLLVIAILDYIVTWSPSFILGVFGTTDEVGLYSVAQRTARLTTFLLVVITSVFMARFAEHYQSSNIAAMDSLARKVASVLFLMGLPLVCLVLIFPSTILSIFGADFERASVYLQVIILGQFVNVSTGAVAFLLILTGHGKKMRNGMIVVAIVVLSLSLVLISEYGAMGAAFSTAIGIALANFLNVYILYSKVGVLSLPINIFSKYGRREN